MDLKTPRPAPPKNGALEEKPRLHAHTIAGRGKKPGPHFDQALDQPVNGPLNFFAPDIELPDYVQEVISQNPHRQPGLISLEALETLPDRFQKVVSTAIYTQYRSK
jgi:hypothetical protein